MEREGIDASKEQSGRCWVGLSSESINNRAGLVKSEIGRGVLEGGIQGKGKDGFLGGKRCVHVWIH